MNLAISQDVTSALLEGRPVVALESAVITAGLPRTVTKDASAFRDDFLDQALPVNAALGVAMQRAVRAAGAVPATTAVIDGRLCIGLDDEQVIALAKNERAGKSASRDLAWWMTAGGDASAGTTVSATIAACRVVNREINGRGSIRVMATGGIGGVHRDWTTVPDVSADLNAIAHGSLCVVCSGAKSMLDIPATLEALETLGVPVVGYETNWLPLFQAHGEDGRRLSMRVDDAASAARLCESHWMVTDGTGGLILANPVPAAWGMSQREVEEAAAKAESLWKAGARQPLRDDRALSAGAARTPAVLAEMARATGGRALAANLALLINNAALAGSLARELA